MMSSHFLELYTQLEHDRSKDHLISYTSRQPDTAMTMGPKVKRHLPVAVKWVDMDCCVQQIQVLQSVA